MAYNIGKKGGLNVMKISHVIEEHFDSIHSMLAILESRTNNVEMSDQHSSRNGDARFTGTKSWNEAVELFENGYTDVLEQIKSGIAKDVRATQNQTRRTIQTGVVGYAPHVPNAINGLPNSMIYTNKQPQKIKAVTIYYAPTENCFVKTETFVKSGIAMLSAINILEMSGVRVNLNVVIFNGVNDGETEGSFGTVKVKDFREHLDVQKLCFPIVHPSLFRRFGFKWLETTPQMKKTGWSYGYGHHTPKFNNFIREQLKENEFLIGLTETESVKYNPEKLIELLNIKK